MILGRDILKSLGFIIEFLTQIFTWNDACIPMKESASNPIDPFHIKDPNGVDEIVGSLAVKK